MYVSNYNTAQNVMFEYEFERYSGTDPLEIFFKNSKHIRKRFRKIIAVVREEVGCKSDHDAFGKGKV